MKTGVKVTVFCKWDDISQDDTLDLLQAVGSNGYVTFTPNKLKAEVEAALQQKLASIKPDPVTGRSKSQTLRDQILKFWNRFYKGKKEFAEYYDESMDVLIGMVKKKNSKAEVEELDRHYGEAQHDYGDTLKKLG